MTTIEPETPDGEPVEPDATPEPDLPDTPDEGEPQHGDSSDSDPDEPGTSEEPGEPATGDAPTGYSVTPEEAEKRMRKAEKAADGFRARQLATLGELGEDLRPCPRCLPFAPGYIFDPDMVPITDEQKTLVLASIGELSDERYLPAPNARRCDTCEGLGSVSSGSRVPAYRTVMCPECQGRGFIAVGGAATNGHHTDVTFAGVEPVATPPEPAPDTDPFGRTPEHPDYGVMPMYAEIRRQRQGVGA